MAKFSINFVNSANIIFESLTVIGRKINTTENVYDNYYISKPNKYGIKWVSINKNDWRGNDISANGKGEALPKHSRKEIYKQF